MKINTDGVLLAAWVNLSDHKKALDIGTGTGVIALMLRQRESQLNVTGIDISKEAITTAKSNFNTSIWSADLSANHTSLVDYKPEDLFDLIISNPPFFVNSLKSSSEKNNLAKHTDSLPHYQLVDFFIQYSHSNAVLAIVLPKDEGDVFIGEAKALGVYCKRLCSVVSHKGKLPKRYLMEFSKNQQKLEEEELVMHEKGERGYSKAYQDLTKDFYLAY